MKHAIGIGGVFIKSKDPKALSAWYQKHLGINLLEWGGAVFSWDEQSTTSKNGATIWSMFPVNSDYFDPSDQKVMLNYVVENVVELAKVLKEEGVEIVGEVSETPQGKFSAYAEASAKAYVSTRPRKQKSRIVGT
jgi:predicted enzyme related to lactoylglutathione lyase